MKKRSASIFSSILLLVTVTLQAQDWANLQRYKHQNDSIQKLSPDDNRVVFMGNSITEGWSQHQPAFFENTSYINRGISGQTTPQMLIRFKQDVIDLQPEVVVICAGTNDIAGNTGPSSLKMVLDNISSMVEIARANEIKVILASVHPAFEYPWRKGLKPNEKIPALNELLKSYAKSNDILYLDYFTAMTDGANGMKNEYTYDGVHPNKKGYEVMAPLAETAIKKALQSK
ncbi:MAG: SGNH/GDSL hydrolase family protein [Flavobacteriaceae bacterium]|nr:SGNH/GDSL hydrolase family protein [Flavobacteriaceae bacterium]